MSPLGAAFQRSSGSPGENTMSNVLASVYFPTAMRYASLEKYSADGKSLGLQLTQCNAVKVHSLFGSLLRGTKVQISTMDL